MRPTEIPPGSIVVVVDSSDTTAAALSWAINEARVEGRRLVLVHAAGAEIATWMELEPESAKFSIEDARRLSERAMQRAYAEIQRRAPDIEVEAVMRLVGPHRALLEFADQAGAIVVGAHGVGPLRPVLNSAFRSVAEHPDCPVIIPRQDAGPAGTGVLVLADGTPSSRATVEYAFREAEMHGLPLTVAHCLTDPIEPGSDLALMDEMARMEAALGPSLLAFQRTLLADLTQQIGSSYPKVVVRALLEDETIDTSLTSAGALMDVVVLDASYWRRAAEQLFPDSNTSNINCVLVLLPSRRPAQDRRAQDELLTALDALEPWEQFDSVVRRQEIGQQATRSVMFEERSTLPSSTSKSRSVPVPVPQPRSRNRHWLRRRSPDVD